MITEAFRRTVRRHGLVAPADTVLVAFSGGQDSAALVELLLDLRRETPISIALAHFNHKLRAGADEDERFAVAFARTRRLPVVTGSRNVRLYAKRRRLNLEEAARDLRYRFLRTAARRVGATKIATGHTLTDQAETVLMRLVRGTGPAGLAGMTPGPENGVIRPLLEVERAETEAYLRGRGVPFRTDESNADRRFLRNRIRLETLPALAAVDPAVVRHIGRLAEIVRDEETLLASVTETAWREVARGTGGAFSLDAPTLERLPRALARRLVRRFLAGTLPSPRAVSFDDVEGILALRPGKEKPLPGRRVVRREGSRLFLKPAAERPPRIGFEVLWDGSGPLVLPGASGRYRASIIDRRGSGLPPFDDGVRALLDASRAGFPMTVRARRPGDRYRPFGAPGAKKLKEILRAKAVPLAQRDDLPVFLSKGRIVWVPGLPVAEAFRIKPGTAKVVRIEKARPRARRTD